MIKERLIVLILLSLYSLFSFTPVRSQSAENLKILTNEAEGSKRWNNLLQIADYLKAETGISFEFKSAPSVKDLIQEIQTEEYDLVYTSLYFYSLARNSDLELSPFIGFTDSKGQLLHYYSCIVASKSSGIVNLDDLKNRGSNVNFKFASPNSSSGHMIPRLELAVEGIALPEMHFKTVGFSTGHTDVKKEVIDGKIDVAGCSCPEGDEIGKINSIWTSPPLMVSFFSTTDQIDAGLQNRLERSFLSFSQDTGSAFYKEIVDSYGFDDFTGFITIDEKPMQSILRSIKEIRDLAFFISYYQDRIQDQQAAIAKGEGILSEQMKELETQSTFIQNQSIMLYVSIAGLVIMFFGGIYVYKNYRNRKKLAEELKERAKASEAQRLELASQKELLLEQKAQIEHIMGETASIVSRAVNEGHFDSRMEEEKKVGEWKTFARSINEFLNSVTTPYQRVGVIFNNMAGGDLTSRYTDEAKGDIQQLAMSINNSLDSLGKLLIAIDKRLGFIQN